MCSASGRPAHQAATSATAAASAATRAWPSSRVSSSTDSGSVNWARVSRCASSLTVSPRKRAAARDQDQRARPPGSSGRTCSADRGVVEHDQRRRVASVLRSRRGPLVQAGRHLLGRHAQRAQERVQRRSPGRPARRGRSRAGSRRAGHRGTGRATRCAQCTANAVLPTPAMPSTAITTTVSSRPASSRSSSSSSRCRPVNIAPAGGQLRRHSRPRRGAQGEGRRRRTRRRGGRSGRGPGPAPPASAGAAARPGRARCC